MARKRSGRIKSVTADGFASAMKELLDEYGEGVVDTINSVVPEIAKETSDRIRDRGRPEWGSYNDGWTADSESKTRTSIKWVVHNVDRYQLAHLLEFSHPMPQGGSSRGHDHITTPSQLAEEELVKRVKEKLNDL